MSTLANRLSLIPNLDSGPRLALHPAGNISLLHMALTSNTTMKEDLANLVVTEYMELARSSIQLLSVPLSSQYVSILTVTIGMVLSRPPCSPTLRNGSLLKVVAVFH